MTDLYEGQFELDGHPFGLDFPVEVSGWTPDTAERIGVRTKIPGADGIRFGPSRYGSATWGFRLFANQQNAPDALQAYQELADVWPTEDVRLNADRVQTLRYHVGGRTRIVYGQGGRWTPVVETTLYEGLLKAAADFHTIDHLFYDDQVQNETVPIALPLSTGGLTTPFIPPFTSLGVNPSQVGQISVGGNRPTPVWIVFNGPVTNPKVIISNLWVAQVLDTVQANDPVTIDARPWARSATRESGGGVKVSPRVTKISKLLLPPGNHTISFSGIDPTGTASVTVNWRNAYSSL